MKHSIQLAAAVLCLAVGAASSRAQVTNTLPLNLQTLNITLTGLVGGGGTNGGSANSFRRTSKDIAQDINLATGVSSSPSPRLQAAFITPTTTNSTNQGWVFVLTSGSNRSPDVTDVTPFFLVDTNSVPLTKGNSTSQLMTFAFGVDTNGVPLTNILGQTLTADTFVVEGLATFQKNGSFKVQVSGSGTSGGNSTVLMGNITATPPNKKAVNVTVIR